MATFDPRPHFPVLKRIVIAIVILIFISMLSPFTIVGAGERGVLLRFSAVQDQIFEEGFHFKTPFIDTVEKVDVTIQKLETQADAASQDLQNVFTQVALNYHVDPLRVNKVYQSFRRNYEPDLIQPAIQEAVKASTAKYTAEELITKRDLVKEDITSLLKGRLEEYGLMVDRFSIVNFSFSDSFNQAIEAKVTAEQDALAAKNRLEQVKFEAEQRIAQAQAEAEAIKIQAQAISAQGGDHYVQLKAVEKWDGVLPQYMLGSSTPFISIPNGATKLQ